MSSQESLKKRVEAVLDMALATISSLAESYTSGVTLGDDSFMDIKDDETRAEEYSYQYDGEARLSRQFQVDRVKVEGGNDEDEDSDDPDEILEVIG